MIEALTSVDSITFSFEPFVREKFGLLLNPTSHSSSGLGGNSEICRLYLKGHCPLGRNCPFKHGSQRSHEKSVVCKHWLRNLCKKGDRCEFLHEYNLKKMPECFFFSKYGECANAECLYLHVDPQSKVKECAWYARGFCKHGPACRNRHVRNTACTLYLTGFCPRGPNCQYGHPKYELPVMQQQNPVDIRDIKD